MRVDYIKVFTDFATALEPLSDAEIGRLFTAMLLYAETGTEPDFRGNERFIWPTAKLQIDRGNDAYKRRCIANMQNAVKGGRPQKNPKNPMGFLETQKTQTPQEEDKDKDKDKEEDKEKESNRQPVRAKRFTPPTLNDVFAYCHERGGIVDAQRWIDYYTANGWMVGKNHMKDWKASVRTWEQREKKSGAFQYDYGSSEDSL